MTSLSTQGMRAFRAVVELKSFKAAGAQLGVSGSAVSKLVAALETELGAVLLQRTTRTLALTEAGSTFYESTVKVLDEINLVADRLREQAAQPRGLLRVSVPTSFALSWLSPRLPDFLVRHPGLQLEITLNDRFVDMVAERCDCAIRISTELPDSLLYARPLGHIARVLVAAPRYLKSAPPLRTPLDLAAHDALIYTLNVGGSAWPFVVDGQSVTVKVDGRLRVNNSVMMRDTLLAGVGLSLVPHFAVADLLASGKLVEPLPTCKPTPLRVYGMTTTSRHPLLKTRLFLDFMEQALRGSGYGGVTLR